MGFFGRKKKKPDKKGPLVMDRDMFMLDEGRRLVSNGQFMEAVMVFERTEHIFRKKLANKEYDDEMSRIMTAGVYAAALGNHALVLARELHRADEALPIAKEAIAVLKKHGIHNMLEEHERILRTVQDRLGSR
jgi:hypothetical protein